MIRTEQDGAVAVVSFESGDAWSDVLDALDASRANGRTRAIVVKVAAFSGLDLDALRTTKLAKDGEALARAMARRFRSIGVGDKPVVAWIEGAAIGPAFELALACTAAVATSDAKLGLPAVELGLLPPANGLLSVAQRAGIRAAIDVGISGRLVSANDAFARGWIDELGDLDTARGFAETLAARPALRDVLPRTRAKKGRSLADLAIDGTPVGRALIVEKAKKQKTPRGRENAERILEVLGRWSLRGFASAAELEAEVFGELVVTEAATRLIELSLAREAIDRNDPIAVERIGVVGAGTLGTSIARAAVEAGIEVRPRGTDEAALGAEIVLDCIDETTANVGPIRTDWRGRLVEIVTSEEADIAPIASLARRLGRSVIEVKSPYTSRLLTAYLEEAKHVVTEGFSVEELERTLVDWGFEHAPLTSMASLVPAPRRAERRIMIEELSLRCSLAMINEAMRCLGEGVLARPAEGDVGAVLGLGFPAFRGGPFRFVDVIGAPDVLRRVRSLEQRFGARFEPAPLLVDMARTGKRFYS